MPLVISIQVRDVGAGNSDDEIFETVANYFKERITDALLGVGRRGAFFVRGFLKVQNENDNAEAMFDGTIRVLDITG